MKSKTRKFVEALENKVKITFQKDGKEIHPVVKGIVNNFGELESRFLGENEGEIQKFVCLMRGKPTVRHAIKQD